MLDSFWNFDDVEVKSNVVPAGVYKVTIVDAEIKTSAAGNDRISVKFSIDEGPQAGRYLFEGFNKSGSAEAMKVSKQRLLALMISCLGKTQEEIKEQMKEGKLNHLSLIGKSCMASVKIQPAQNGYEESNKISSWKPLSDEQKAQTPQVPF